MEIPAQQSDVRIGGDFQKSNFKIAQTRHTFQILSSGLYSDKERAIVRELACNAWDAHTEAGKRNTPFIICLPNHVEPFFKIRDFGTGLSHDDVTQVYTTYFESTKQKSNDQIGCFGLGSKSPFAYTKNFSVVSYLNGEKRTYNMIINDDGLPAVIHVATETTDEENGLEVSFAVKRGDQWEFRNAAEKVLRPFGVLPTIKGISNFNAGEEPEALIDGPSWKVFRNRNMPDGMSEQCAIMGNVEYPITEQKGFSPNARMVLSLPIRITFPIGSFEVTPSRESISWTDYSKQNVNQILEDIYDAVVKHVNDQISGATSLWEARKQTWSLLHNSVISKMKIRPLWKGMQVTPTIKVSEGTTVLKMVATEKLRDGDHVITCKTHKVAVIDPVDTEFFLADFKSAQYRTSSYVRDLDNGQHVYLIESPKKKALKTLLKEIGVSGKDVRLSSSIPKKVSKGGGGVGGRRSRLSGTKARAFVLNGNFRGYADNCWDEAEVELNGGGVYLQIHRYKVVTAPGYSIGNGMDPTYLRSVVRSLRSLLGEKNVPVIVGVKTAKVAKFSNADNWFTLSEFIQKKVWEIWDADKDLRTAYRLFEVRRKGGNDERDREAHIEMIDGAKKLHDRLIKDEHEKDFPDSAIIKYFSVVSRVLNKRRSAGAVSELGEWMTHGDEGFSVVALQKDPDYRGILLKHYPLLGIAEKVRSYGSGLWGEDKILVQLKEYVSFMDGLRAQGVQV